MPPQVKQTFVDDDPEQYDLDRVLADEERGVLPADMQQKLQGWRAVGRVPERAGALTALRGAQRIGPERTWMERVAAPAAGAVAGGVAGGRMGAALPLPPTLRPLAGAAGAIIGAGVGAAGGELTGRATAGYRGVPLPEPPVLARQVGRAAVTGAAAEAIGLPVGAAAARMMRPFAPDVTPMGHGVAARFGRRTPPGVPQVGLPGLPKRPVTAVTPGEVAESPALHLMESMSRAGIFGRKRWQQADTAAKAAINEEIEETLMKPLGPAVAPAAAGQRFQQTVAQNRARYRARGGQMYEDAFAAARTANVGVLRPSPGGDVLVPLEKLHATLSQLNRQARALRLNPEKEHLRQQYVDQAKQIRELIDGAVADDPTTEQLYKAARDFWRKGRERYDIPVVRGAEQRTADAVAESILRGGAGLKPTRIPGKQVMMSIEQQVKALQTAAPQAVGELRSALAHRLIADATDADSGFVVGSEMQQALQRGGKALEQALGPDYRNWVQVADALAYKQRNRPEIGSWFIRLRTPVAAAQLATGTPTVIAGTVLAGPLFLSRVLTNRKAVKWLTTGLNANWETPTKQAINAFSNLAAFELAAPGENDSEEDFEEVAPRGIPAPPIPSPPVR